MPDYLVRLIRKASKRVPPARSGRFAFGPREAKPRRPAPNAFPATTESVEEAVSAATAWAPDSAAPPAAHEIPPAAARPSMPTMQPPVPQARRAPVITPALIEPMRSATDVPLALIARQDAAVPLQETQPDRAESRAVELPSEEIIPATEPGKPASIWERRPPRIEFTGGAATGTRVLTPVALDGAVEAAADGEVQAVPVPAVRTITEAAPATEGRPVAPSRQIAQPVAQPASRDEPWPAITIAPDIVARPPAARAAHAAAIPPGRLSRESASEGLTIQQLDVQIVDRSPDPPPPLAPPAATPSWPDIDRHHVRRVW